MSGLKSSGLLLILAAPLIVYALWQFRGLVHTDQALPEPPSDRGAADQAGQSRSEAAAASDVREAAAFTIQFSTTPPAVPIADRDAVALIKAAAARSADLNDLDAFLSELERPDFRGQLKPQYLKWMEERKDLKRDTEAVAAWLARPPAVASAADAAAALEEIGRLIATYATRSKFSDKSRVDGWREQARQHVAKALRELADRQYQAAVRVKLPLDVGGNAVKTAVETHRALKELLGSDEWMAREELLKLFAQDDLFTNPTAAPVWLKQVASRYRRTKDELVRELIRDKVQEFCDAFIPAAARLDDTVLIRGNPAPRKEVIVKYAVSIDGKEVTKREALAPDFSGLNEFNLEQKRPGMKTFVVYDGREDFPKDLKPTELSKAAVAYNAARKKLGDSTTVPKWSAKSVEELKKMCEGQKDLLDQLQLPGGGSTGTGPRIWTRLAGLAAGLAGCADLYDAVP